MPRTLDLTDRELTRLASGGARDAFEELYRRHSQAAWRVAQAVTHNPDSAADAVSEAFTRVFQALPQRATIEFRPYLMAITRNAAIDTLRRGGRIELSDTVGDRDSSPSAGPTDVLIAGADASLVAIAFRGLPERWRSILWLTEVEGLPPREAGALLGLSANGAAQLAVRARAGLRERYLQAHLRTSVSDECKATVPILGAYVAGGLSPREVARVDQHLAGCEACRERVAELEDLGTTLRRVALPFPLALAGFASAGGLAAWTGSVAASTGAASGSTSVAARAGSSFGGGGTRGLERQLLYASIGLLAVSIMATAVLPRNRAQRPQLGGRPAPGASTPAPATVDDFTLERQAEALIIDRRAARRARGGSQVAAPSPSGPKGNQPTPPKPPPRPVPIANATVRLGSGTQTIGASAGGGDGSCTGLQISTTTVGCAPPSQPQGKTLTITTAGSVLGNRTISVP